MGRGRKPAVQSQLWDWTELFNKNVGTYLQSVIIGLGEVQQQGESGVDLLSKIRNYKTERNNFKAYPLIKDDEKPYTIPDNWVWCRLGEVIEVTDNLNIESKLSKDTLINYVDIDAIDNKNYQIRESKLKPVAELSSRARRVLKKGYILYSLVRPYLNNVAIVHDEKSNYIGSTGFSVFNGIFIENELLKYYLLTDYVRELFLGFLSGFNSPSISFEQFALALIPLPPISEQKKILAFLNNLERNTLDENGYYIHEEIGKQVLNIQLSQLKTLELGLELNHQLNLVKKLRQQLLQDAIQGKLTEQNPNDEPARILLQKIKAEKERLIKGKKLKKELAQIKPEEIPFDIPENWVWCRLTEICTNITKGSSPSWQGVKYVEEENGILYITSKNVDSYKIDLSKATYVEEKFNEIEPRSILKKGDILTNIVGASIGRTALYDLDTIANINQAVCLLRIENKEFNKTYLLYLMNSDFALKLMSDSQFAPGRANLSMGNISNFPIPLPPLNEQNRIIEKIEQLMQTCDALEASIKQSQQQNAQLLQQVLREALTGKRENVERALLEDSPLISTPLTPSNLNIPPNRKNFAKQVLGGKIVSLFNEDKNFTHIKFQKLQYLAEHIAEADLDLNYYFQAAGPHDGKFMHTIASNLKRSQWFEERNFKFYPLAKANGIDQYYQNYFGAAADKLDNLFSLLAKASENQAELIATLYAVWNNRIIKKEPITDELLYQDFYKWSTRKEQYSLEQLNKGLLWMREKGIVPTGFGKEIKKAKKPR